VVRNLIQEGYLHRSSDGMLKIMNFYFIIFLYMHRILLLLNLKQNKVVDDDKDEENYDNEKPYLQA
jgi:hypothetical protein